jgi:beta-1,4-mannosyl-glycoprotein beta-1,4-N-acetylglucosaminyltransferase
MEIKNYISKLVEKHKQYSFFKEYKNKYKIYDCFLFFNENDLLEVRLNELYSIVDYFIILESSSTFTKNHKGFLLDLKRFEKFKNKIIYIQNNEGVRSPNPWETEKFQRNKISEGLNLPFLPAKSEEEDMIMLSDLDEIPKKDKVIEAFYEVYHNDKKYIRISMTNYFYKFDNRMNEPNQWDNLIISRKKYVNSSMQDFRGKTPRNECTIIDEGGWHYSYFYKDISDIMKKIASYSHTENNRWPNDDRVLVENNIKIGKSNNLNSPTTFSRVLLNSKNCPKYVLKNLKNYDKLLFDYERHLIWTQIMLFYNKKIRKIKEYTLGIRNKSSEKINQIRTKFKLLVQGKIKKP